MSADLKCIDCEGEQGKQCQSDYFNVFTFVFLQLKFCFQYSK